MSVLEAIIIGGILLLIGIRLFGYWTLGVFKSEERIDGKVVIVTGCTSGIGKETAKDLARRGAKVIMACRNLESAKQVRDELAELTGNENIIVRKLDLSSLKSVREFAQQINREETKLDVLIHNAGIVSLFKRQMTEDGLEITMATNHFGPFLLTILLLDLLKNSAPSRVVVVASKMYCLVRLNLDNLNSTSIIPGYLYSLSKHANIIFTLELARRLQGTGVTANCLHPGVINTGIWKNFPVPLFHLLNLTVLRSFKTPEEGAQTTIYLAVSKEVAGVSGKYFTDCREYPLPRGVQNKIKGKKFWELSEKFVKLEPTNPKI